MIKKRWFHFGLSTLFAGVVLSVANPAAAEDFTFSMEGTYSYLQGSGGMSPVSKTGIVTGLIQGLPYDGIAAATAVWIETIPTDLLDGVLPTPFSVNLAAVDLNGFPFSNENTFTTLNGQIINAHLALYYWTYDEEPLIGINDSGHLLNDMIDLASLQEPFDNTDGLQHVTFAPVSVPEPTSAMILLMVGFTVGMRRRSRRNEKSMA